MQTTRQTSAIVTLTAIATAATLLDAVAAPLSASVSNTAAGWVYRWDVTAVVPDNTTNLVTNLPGAFTGADVSGLIGATKFYTNGVTGQNSIASNIEAGHIWGGHETLGHVVSRTNDATAPTAPFGAPAYDRHATWVGMMIGGRQGGGSPGVYQNGMAPQTDLRSGGIATGWAGTAYAGSFNATVTSLDFPYSSAASGFGTADVINSSWGSTGSGSGSPERQGTDIRAMTVDGLANGNRFTTFVAAAGNDGSGANTVGSPGAGYNGITVGALQNDGANNYSSVASFSSRGPQDYGDPTNGLIAYTVSQRAAVDIVAPGTNLTSAFYGGQTGGNDASLSGSANTPGVNLYNGGVAGTSFASPITAGGVALMHSAAVQKALPANAEDTRVIKAALLNAASKIAGWSNGQVTHPNGNGGMRTTQALDFASGAGALDLDRTYTQYVEHQTDLAGMAGGSTADPIGWDYASVALLGQTDTVITTTLQGGTEFRATLSWFRDRTYNGVGSITDVGFADLNLAIWNSSFTTLYSDSISLYTPVEHLAFVLPVTGTYGIRVSYPQNVFGNVASEEYGLAWWGVGIPEPSCLALFGVMGALLGLRRRRA